ncbi:Cytokinin dehydrogenase 5 [Striga hermonthica]|uniref:cytokinin dehydrogenase n=1 Tax=Striga hermonthica TaxID=68872 RepID=A0A9N7RSY2_STRHE|nr:Cytokinin dehydrogenase 5 [Striga hermonthica]
MPAKILLLTFAICRLIAAVGLTLGSAELLHLEVEGRLSLDPADAAAASRDFGGAPAAPPMAVLRPASAGDVARLVKEAYGSARVIAVSARGHGHSISGQAAAGGGVVVQMTGKGETHTCSEEQNSELYHAVLGGLGQFGIITRARIALEKAPTKVKWIRVLYSNFSAFTQDQEYLVSLHGKEERFDYVEGFVIVDEGLINNWRSSFFSPRNPVKISTLNADGGVLYCLEVVKNYVESNADTIDEEVEAILKKLNFIPSSVFTTEISYVDFLDRVHKAELKLRAKNLWDVPHPWLNLFVPKSRIADFDEGVFKGILGNNTSGPILIYPMNKNKWDERTSVVTPDEDVFYLVALLRSALDNGEETQTLEYLSNQNRQILRFCEEAGIKVKQYLPHYTTQEEWKNHFGEKWALFSKRKDEFDPRHILATGQRIFTPNLNPMGAS